MINDPIRTLDCRVFESMNVLIAIIAFPLPDFRPANFTDSAIKEALAFRQWGSLVLDFACKKCKSVCREVLWS